MIAVTPVAPTPAQVVIGVLAVIAGALIASTSAYLARRSHNWLHLVASAGGGLIVAGVVGQRTPVSGAAIGPWDAGINVPVLGIAVDPVTAAGVIAVLAGLVVVLLVERVPDEGRPPVPLVHRPLEEDDAV